MLKGPLHQLAVWLLKAAIRVAPPEIRAWGEAMLAELPHIESVWTALFWALGGSIVLAKHAVASMLGFGRQNVSSGGGLFARRISLRKTALASSGIFVLASLLFFAAPPFRQGLRLSVAPWRAVYRLDMPVQQPKIQAFARRAEARHDPEAMVFSAVRLWDANESARLADGAVRLDPRLLWAYAIVAVRHPELTEIHQWLPRLEQWQPGNALFPLVAAEMIDIGHLTPASKLSPQKMYPHGQSGPAWRNAMAAAFSSAGFDDYLDHLKHLDRDVVRRYRFNDPYLVLLGEQNGLPSFANSDARRYAESLFYLAEMERGVPGRSVAEVYWSVASFGQVMDSHARTDAEREMGLGLQSAAYNRLEALSKATGNSAEATLFGYLSRKFDADALVRTRFRERLFGLYVTRRNAFVLEMAGSGILIFAALLIAASIILMVHRRGDRSSRRIDAAMTIAGLTSSVGLLLSFATVYLTYRPYWYILQSVMQGDHTTRTRDLLDFLAFTQGLPVAPGSHLWLHFPVYFWASVIFAGISVLLVILLRHFGEPLPEPQPNSHAQ